MISVFRPFGPLVFCSFCFFFIYKFFLFSLFPTFIIFTDFLDTRVLLPSDASPSQYPSGLAKAISPILLSTIKHSYEHDEPPSHEHIANQELSFHTSVIDMKTISAPPMYSLGLQINPFASGSIFIAKESMLSTMVRIHDTFSFCLRTIIYKQATHNWAFLWEILFGEYLFYQNIGHFKLYEG
ncbi:hypothetical protein F4703DRAFT_1796019 [Phycomyces blakesleeanus]